MSEIRYDRLHDTHVLIAPERLRHPDVSFDWIDPHLFAPSPYSPEPCPFCEGNEVMTPPEIFALRPEGSFSNEGGWETRVIPNLFKAVQIETPPNHHFGLYEYWEGFGAHEVIIDIPSHKTSMCDWTYPETVAWLKTLRQRVGDLRRDNRLVYMSLFKNEGKNAGAKMHHCHTQLIALPMVPKMCGEIYRRAYEYFQTSGHALMESILLHEEETGVRIIDKMGEFISFCPYASAYPFEVMISSVKEAGQIDTLSRTRIDTVAALLLSTLQRLKRQLGVFHFNLWISTPPLLDSEGIGSADLCRFTIRIMPRLYLNGGFENTTGIMINPVSPELAAKLLRESIHE